MHVHHMARPILMRALQMALALECGCSLTFDGSQAYPPLDGHPPSLVGAQTLSVTSVQTISVIDADGVPWAAIYEPSGTSASGPVRLVKLADPIVDTLYDPGSLGVQISLHRLYVYGNDSVDIVRPDDPISTVSFTSPITGLVVPAESDRALMVLPLPTSSVSQLAIMRCDGSYQRAVTYMPGSTALITPGGDWVLTYDSVRWTAHLTSAELDVPLDATESQPVLDDVRQQLVECGPGGVRAVPYGGGPARVLDDQPCQRLPPALDEAGLPVIAGNSLLYWTAESANVVPLDGSAPPRQVVPLDARVLAYADGGIAFSRVGSHAFFGEAGDGWIGMWRFMERGRSAAFARATPALRWIEHAANDVESGELRVAPTLGGAVGHLARNVTEFDELDDGRVIAESNRAWDDDVYSRVIVIDEAAGRARWVGEGVKSYTLLPGQRAVLAVQFSQDDTRHYVRFAIPPKEPTP
jgi:hypothetical protein